MSQSAKTGASQEPPTAPARRGRAGPAGEDALGLAATALARAGFHDPQLVLRWREIAGPAVARIAEPVKWQESADGAVLTLKCDAAAGVFLQHETRALIGRLNAYLGPGRVARLKLMRGELRAAAELPSHPFRSRPAATAGESKDLPSALDRLASVRRALRK